MSTGADLTVIIPVRDDPLVYRCLASIDVPCPVIISTNGSPDWFVEGLRTYAKAASHVTVLSTSESGIGLAYNRAIVEAVTPLVLLMDSDCVFEPGAIASMRAEASFGLVKGRVRFESEGRSSRLVASARRLTEDPLVTNKVNAYSPPLLYRTDIVEKMGGYHFSTAMKWREDRDFELRRRRSNIPVRLVPEAVIWHKPLSVRADLRSVRAYGAGQAHGEFLKVLPVMSLRHEPRKARRVVWRGIRNGNPGAGFYAAFRN
ncbi:glycosyltransferase family 2 protein [Streptomyces antarcticus]|uniref:glycosyltransferase family 2 protein n=1 Tax=Streptomyces antarcticus TaxID=2996458 RepID=UPI0022704386|nr:MULTISPECIES: glycosyltransferase [unclassified Streptomyces]MCY0943359.1 glycosyltransferase [Streptomyces sp. H34-AA3]MCZ4085329.1 glycosyltransferase [Streptomyces sp. H34-S5]